ncbi:MAG: VOC family protein [Anaerolineae bacterium]|nr:VOC family protein [Anaerolineae bacterium]
MTTHTQKKTPGTPTWADLMTTDPDAAREFYGKLFGWTYFMSGPEFGYYSNAALGNNVVAGLGPIPPDTTMPAAWTVYLASDNVDADSAKVSELGGQVVTPPMTIGEFGRMVICVDPTGAVFGMWESNQHIGAVITDEHGTMTWHEVNSREAAKAKDFYCALHGQTSQLMPTMEYYMLNLGSKTVAGVLQMDAQWEGIPPHWMVYFAVNNTDATIEQTVALGGKMLVPAFDTPFGRVSVLADPQGASFSVIQLSARAQTM